MNREYQVNNIKNNFKRNKYKIMKYENENNIFFYIKFFIEIVYKNHHSFVTELSK